MHRAEVLNKYGRYIIGTVEGQKPKYLLPTPGTLSPVPYAEATWIREGFKSPYYRDSHRALQKAVREFTDEFVKPDAQLHEKDGKRPTVELIQKMGEINMNAMVCFHCSILSTSDGHPAPLSIRATTGFCRFLR